MADPHLKAVDLIQTMEHPSEGKIRMIAPPIIFSQTPSSIYRHPPGLGEHTDEVFEAFGIAKPQQPVGDTPVPTVAEQAS